MSIRCFALLATSLVALTLGSCDSLRPEGGFKRPQELTATARAMLASPSRVAKAAPTAPSRTASPTTRPPSATLAPTATSTVAGSTAAPTHTAQPAPSPTLNPSPVPTAVEAPACGHPYFSLPSQGYWRYAITTRHGDGEPAPQAPEEMRVVSTESDAGRTIATLNYSFERSDSPSFTYRVDCTYRQGVLCRSAGGVWPRVDFGRTAWDPGAPPRWVRS